MRPILIVTIVKGPGLSILYLLQSANLLIVIQNREKRLTILSLLVKDCLRRDMTQYNERTKLPFTEEDYIEQTLARLGRIAKKGIHPGRYIFYEHEVKEVLKELIKEVKEMPEPHFDTPVNQRIKML
jgi:hypothetical protein